MTPKKKILILSYYYYPANFVGAERISSFVRHINKFGYYPIIVTRNWNENQTTTYEKIIDNSFKHHVFDKHEEHYLPYNRSLRDKLFSKNNFFWTALRRILTLIELLSSSFFVSALPYANLYYHARKILQDQKDIEILLVSGSPFESFHFGYLLKKEFPHIHWIPDYRDEWTSFQGLKAKDLLNNLIFRMTCRNEQKWTSNISLFLTVSENWVKHIESHIHKKGKCVMNGFETLTYNESSNTIIRSHNEFIITYNGTIYPEQDFSIFKEALFKAVLSFSKSVKVTLQFIGIPNDLNLHNQIRDLFNWPDIRLVLTKRIDKSSLIKCLRESDLLLLTAYSDVKGWYPVKMFDYYMVRRPVLLCPTDYGDMEEYIQRINIGRAVGNTCDCQMYLEELISAKLNGQNLDTYPNAEIGKFYSREHQASILATHLDELIDVKTPSYQICNRCVMDTSDEDITFDELGICNHCRDFEKVLQQPRYRKEDAEKKLSEMISQIKRKNNQYDCLIGISGGVDSCYTAYLCHKWGLRPLLMHMDNGWNSEIAVRNIQNLVEKLNLDYISYVLDWNEFREVQLAFLKSSIVDLEIPTDIAIPASLYEIASKYNISYIMSGGNYSGEGILPLTWGYHVLKDAYLYKHIVNQYSKVKLKKIPIVGLWKEIYYKFFKGIKTLYPLNLIEYDKDEAREFLKREFNWVDYGGKHHESKITAFWQSYVMPTKYNMDYRRATYSSQIVSGQIAQEQAIEKLKELPYNPDTIPADKEYIAKKFGITSDELEHYLSEPPKTYKDFPNQKNVILYFYSLYKKIANQ